jgi:predicted Zn finger-like uncharacterized protein
MGCPKCKAKIGVMKHEILLDAGFVQCTRCVLCGYRSPPYSPYKRKNKTRYDHP